jgi:O-antigen/teichoic acid export membrane protein
MNRSKKLFKNTAYVVVGNLGTRFISLIIMPFYTYWLVASEFGTIDLVSTYVMLFSGIVNFGLPEALFRFPKNKPIEEKKKYVTSAVTLLMYSAVFIFIVFTLIRCIWHVDNVFTQYTYYIYTFLFLTSFTSFLTQLSRGLDRIDLYSSTGIIGSLVNVSLVFVLVPKYHVVGCFMMQIIASLVVIFYLCIRLRISHYINLKCFSRSHLREMLAYSVPIIPNSIFWWTIDASNKLFLESYIGLSAVGLFALSNKFPTLLSNMVNLFFVSWQITSIEEYQKENYAIFYNKIFRSLFLFAILLSAAAVVVTKLFIIYILSDNYAESAQYLPILYMSLAFSVMSSFFATNFTTYKNTKMLFYTTVIGAGVAIIINFLLIPYWGVWAAALSIMLSQMSVALVRYTRSEKYIHLINKQKYLVTCVLYVLGMIMCILLNNSMIYTTINVLILLIIVAIINRDAIKPLTELILSKINSLRMKYRKR